MPLDDIHVLVVFYSRGGLTERIAVWLAEGAVQAGAKIRLRRARDIAPEERMAEDAAWAANSERMHQEYAAPTAADAEWAHVLALGTPASDVMLSPEMGAWLDQFRNGELGGKIGTGFTSGYLPGQETGLMALQMAMTGLGLSLVPRDSGSGERDWELAHAQGKRAVEAARR